MSTQIIPFQTGINTCYLVRQQGTILVDGGYSRSADSFRKFLKTNQVHPEELKLVILTHGDFDHAGGAGAIKELTGARIAIHEADRDYLEKGIFHWAAGVTPWGKISRSLFKPMMVSSGSFSPLPVDVVIDDGGLDLREYGIEGRVIHTPGHTGGHVSVVLDSGEAFVGCLAHNRLPFTLRPKLPIYADDIHQLKESWNKVIEWGASTCYPGHGKPFAVEKILRYLN